MTSFLLDTHVWSWSLLSTILPTRVTDLLNAADTLHVSVISLYEIRQKVRLGKWPQMASHASGLADLMIDQGITMPVISSAIADLAGALEWDHRDPFDRIIAATAISLKLPLMSADDAFDQLASRKDWPGRTW